MQPLPDRTFAVRAPRDPQALRHLRTLVLSHCKLGDKGVAHLAAALPNNVFLTELDGALERERERERERAEIRAEGDSHGGRGG
jgi:hypothetical protein